MPEGQERADSFAQEGELGWCCYIIIQSPSIGRCCGSPFGKKGAAAIFAEDAEGAAAVFAQDAAG